MKTNKETWRNRNLEKKREASIKCKKKKQSEHEIQIE